MTAFILLGAAGTLLAIWLAVTMAFAVWMAYLVYHPPVQPSLATPAKYGLPCELWRVHAGEPGDPEIDAWWIPAAGAPATILIMHEWGSQKARKLAYASLLYQQGFSVLLFDLRNHGASGRDRGALGMADESTRDLLAVIERWRATAAGPDPRMGILAFSFSTWPALYYGAVHRPRELNALVLDSGPPTDIGETAVRFIALYGDRWIPRVFRLQPGFALLKRVYVSAVKLMLGGRWPPALGGLRAATLFITGADDPLMLSDDVRRIAQLAGGQHDVWLVPDCGHLKAFSRHEAEYRAKVGGFFSATLHRPTDATPDAVTQAAAAALQLEEESRV